MGKTSAQRTAKILLDKFDTKIIICLGIAGSLSNDLGLGDVCYSGSIIDVLDNSKASDVADGIDIEFSPTHFLTPREIEISLNQIRISPELRQSYERWQFNQWEFVEAILPNGARGRDGHTELTGPPNSMNGTIACAGVSKSEKYNTRLRGLDRKILAVETEIRRRIRGGKCTLLSRPYYPGNK